MTKGKMLVLDVQQVGDPVNAPAAFLYEEEDCSLFAIMSADRLIEAVNMAISTALKEKGGALRTAIPDLVGMILEGSVSWSKGGRFEVMWNDETIESVGDTVEDLQNWLLDNPDFPWCD